MVQSARTLLSAAVIGLGLPALAQAQITGPLEIPDGDGKALVQGICVSCHQTDLITGSVGYTEEGWRYLVGQMIELSDPIASDIAAYLAANFPPSGEREAVLIPGDEIVTFKEWTTPTLGQRPRDPFMHSDGTIWWAGMYGSLVGRLDPATGEMTEIRLDPTARPHTVLEGPGGDVWYTGNSNGTIGRIDRDTGEITVYPLNDPAARDPHTAAFAEDGSLWFTVQNSNMLGRLDPATGEVWLRDIPTERARPYGIRRDAEGNLWVAYRGAYKIARVNPETREYTEFETPNFGKYPGMGHYVRRLAVADDGMIWYVDSGRGEIGRFDPETETFKQWPSPAGVASHPYAIEVINGIVWYNESDMRPDTLVRFDPATETFQSWAIPSDVGIIRNMESTPNGNLVIHQSSTNTVGLVIIGENNAS
jgi:virginiamycin B lyase